MNRCYSSAQDFALRCEVRGKAWRLRRIKPSRSDFAWLDACNRKPKAELLRIDRIAVSGGDDGFSGKYKKRL